MQAEKAAAVKKKGTAKAREIAERIATFPQLHSVRRFICSNVTPETYPEIMLENEGATSILDDEGDLFDLLAGRYQEKPTLDPFLKGYNGSPLESHRRNNSSFIVPKANLSVMILAQPFVVSDVFKSERNRRQICLPTICILCSWAIPPIVKVMLPRCISTPCSAWSFRALRRFQSMLRSIMATV